MRREEKSENEIQMIQELAKVCLEQAEMAQKEKIWKCNQQYESTTPDNARRWQKKAESDKKEKMLFWR